MIFEYPHVQMILVPGSPPQNVRARPVSSSTVVVQWEEPRTPNGVIRVCNLIQNKNYLVQRNNI